MKPKTRAAKIAQDRIQELYELAEKEYKDHPKDARNYIAKLRVLATKHNLRITELKRTFCKQCNTLLVPGETSTVRIHNNRRVITCTHCGTIKRLGLSARE